MRHALLPALLRLSAFLIMSEDSSAQGKVVFEGPVASDVLGTNRFVRIFLPPSYEQAPRKRYPVLYLHDGQNVFSTAGDHVAFGWGNWQLDRTVTELVQASRMEEIIMVAVDHTAERYLDYRGPAHRWTEMELAAQKRRPPAPGDDSRYLNYSRFLIEELKPKIDRGLPHKTGPGQHSLDGGFNGRDLQSRTGVGAS